MHKATVVLDAFGGGALESSPATGTRVTDSVAPSTAEVRMQEDRIAPEIAEAVATMAIDVPTDVWIEVKPYSEALLENGIGRAQNGGNA